MGAGSPTAPADAADGYAPLPMGPGYVLRQENFFRLNAWCSVAGVTLTLAGQIAGDDGCIRPFVFTLAPTSNRATTSAIFPASPGTLLCCQVIATSGTPARGQCFVRLELLVGKETSAFALATILQQYVTNNVAAAYPGSEIDQPDEGPGAMRSIAGTDQPAGTEVRETVPTNARWRLAAVKFSLVTSAVVANRIVGLQLDDGVNAFYLAGTNVAQAATQSLTYVSGDAVGAFGQTSNTLLIAIPRCAMLLSGFRFGTNTVALDAGDNYGPPQYLVEEWIDV